MGPATCVPEMLQDESEARQVGPVSSAFGLLLIGGLPVLAQADTRIVDAMARQNGQAVRALMKQGVDVNARTADGTTALHWAAHWDDFESVALLLKAGARIDATDDHGVTAAVAGG